MNFHTSHTAQLGREYTSMQIDDLFAVSGHQPIRSNPQAHTLVLVNDSALDINADQWGAGYLRFAGMPEAIGVHPTDTLNQILEGTPENGMDLEIFTKTGYDQYLYLGHAARCDFKDGSRHQWAHIREDQREADVMVFLVQPETWPTQAALDAQRISAEVSISPWQDQDLIPLGEDAAEEVWAAAEEEYMNDLLHDAAWPCNQQEGLAGGQNTDAFWQLREQEVPMEQKGIEPMEVLQETTHFIDAAAAARFVDAMVEDHLLKKGEAPKEPETEMEIEMEETIHDPFWSLWQH